MAEESEKKTAETISAKVSDLVLQAAGVARLPGKAQTRQKKGIKAVVKDKRVTVNIHIVVDFGRPIPEIARLIQGEVKNLMKKEFPDQLLQGVNIWVDGIHNAD